MKFEGAFNYKMPNDTLSVREQELIEIEKEERRDMQEQAKKEYREFLNQETEEQQIELKKLEEKYRYFHLSNRKKINEEQRFEVKTYNVPAECLSALGLEDLPDGVGVKGGAARYLLQATLGMKTDLLPRDIDLIIDKNILDYEDQNDRQIIVESLQEYMDDDFEHKGEELLFLTSSDNLTDHFKTQDFTINEVYYMGGQIFATQKCIEDTKSKKIRITEYEKRVWEEKGMFYSSVGPKVMLKALRFWARSYEQNGDAYISEFQELDFGIVSGFWLLLNLRKSFEEGNDVAQRFWNKVISSLYADSKIRIDGKEKNFQEFFKAVGNDPTKAMVYLSIHMDGFTHENTDLINELARDMKHHDSHSNNNFNYAYIDTISVKFKKYKNGEQLIDWNEIMEMQTEEDHLNNAEDDILKVIPIDINNKKEVEEYLKELGGVGDVEINL